MISEALIFPLWSILMGWMIAGGSPGPATLTISATSMSLGRAAGLRVAAGIVVGSTIWGSTAALGFSAVMMANAWLFDLVCYAGAAYLLWLAVKSLRSAWQGHSANQIPPRARRLFLKGLLLHLTNPKAILSWGSIYAIALTPDAPPAAVWSLFAALSLSSIVLFFGYALLFASRPIVRGYTAAKRWFEFAFGVLFGVASLKMLTVRLQ